MSAGPLIIAGANGPREMAIRTVWRKTGGAEYERRFWGPADQVRMLEPSVIASGAMEVSFDQQNGSPIAILSARYTGRWPINPSDAVETMSIDFTDETFPLNYNPTFCEIPTSTIQLLDQAIEDKTRDVLDGFAPTDPEYRYFELRARHTDDYKVFLPYVTWRRIVGDDYPSALDLENVGWIYSTGDLVAGIGAPVLWSVPTGNVGVLDDSRNQYRGGWRKCASAGFTGDGKNELVITAQFGLWALDAYQFFVGE